MTFLPRCGECAGCATDGRLPCRVGSAANAAGTLVGGGSRLHRGRRAAISAPPRRLRLRHARRGQPHLGGAGSTPTSRPRSPRCSAARCSPAAARCSTPAGRVAGERGGRGRPRRRRAWPRCSSRSPSGTRSSGSTRSRPSSPPPAGSAPRRPTTRRRRWRQGVRAPVVIEAAGSARGVRDRVRADRARRHHRDRRPARPGRDARRSRPLALTAEARTVVGSYLGSAVPERDIPRYVELWRAGRLPLERLVSGRIGLARPRRGDGPRSPAGGELRQLIMFDDERTRNVSETPRTGWRS